MKYKLNSKGQGALEYLLIIGGVVLVAVIVVALLIGMSTDNSENAKKQTSEFISNTDIALPSTVLSVICKEKTAGPDEYVVKWNATHKDGYDYTLLFDDSPITFESFNILPSTNPIVFTINDDLQYMETGASKIKENCSELGSEAISIKTTNTENQTTAVSNRVFIKPQAAVTPSGPSNPSITFDTAAGTTVLSNHGITANPMAFYFIRIYNLSGVELFASDRIFTAPELNAIANDGSPMHFWGDRLVSGEIKHVYEHSEINNIKIIEGEDESVKLTIPVSNMTID